MDNGIAIGLGVFFILMFIIFIIAIVFGIIGIVSNWKLFEKAGKPGWAAIVPVYNIWNMSEIATGNPLDCILWLIPYVNLVIMIYCLYGFYKSFGANTGEIIISLLLFPIVPIKVLLYPENYEYLGPQIVSPCDKLGLYYRK